jgi:hypothetical protein
MLGGGGRAPPTASPSRARPGMAGGGARLGQSSSARQLCPRQLESWKLSKISWERWRGRRPASHGTRGGGPEKLTDRQQCWESPGGWEEGEKLA